jgi:hypothetical protein
MLQKVFLYTDVEKDYQAPLCRRSPFDKGQQFVLCEVNNTGDREGDEIMMQIILGDSGKVGAHRALPDWAHEAVLKQRRPKGFKCFLMLHP